MPLVSILIPCFNAEAHVAQAIESALAQTHTDVEVVVVDDGSTDRSLVVIEGYVGSPGFRHETGPNRGGNAARNRLLQLARGEYTQFLDADDVLHPRKVATCLEALSDDIDMVYCDYLVECGGVRGRVRLADPGPDLVAHFIRHNAQTSLPLHRTKDLRAVGGFDESLRCCQEHEFHLRLARRAWKRVRHIPEPLCTLRRVEGSVSSGEARVYDTLAGIMLQTLESLRTEGGLTPARADAIAAQLLTCSRHLVRHGIDDPARAAFRAARRVSPKTRGPYRRPMWLLARIVGPVWAERLRRGR